MTQLYVIADTYAELADAVNAIGEDGGADLDALTEALSKVEGDFRMKTQRIAGLARDLDLRADSIDVEIERLQRRSKAARASSAWLRGYLLDAMKQTGQKQLVTERFTLTVVANPPALRIFDPVAIPAEYLIVETFTTYDNKAIKKAVLTDGIAVPGAEITRGEHLRIS